MEQAHATVSSAERELHSATERLAQAAHHAVDTLSEYGGRAEERLRSSGSAASERSRELVDQVTQYVEDHPLAAVGIAVAVGFAVGMMIRGGETSERPDELS
jgi:ElaB/YqjD/DUF883 family membrane-anchored ribosome-binding protein